MVVKGSCNCGRIRVTMDNPTPSGGGVMICYCLNCRKQSGAAGTYVVVVENKDMVLTGSPKKFLDTNTACGRPLDRYFCYNCGCPIMYRILMFGLFEDIPKPVAEVWTKRRPEWIPATSEVLQYVTDIPDDVSGEEAKKLGW
ncbi:hypothetical protein AtubIFM54640_002606 [Aspergillus tubingensis]|nr:hypothetical protein AtubIFM54640_002606 [Aspergillus tubingensis]GLB23224.1 hypothetical protein AtubIFM61612_003813 [Aspergillus tubingensis]